METQDVKCVMVIDEGLPLGIVANTAAVLGITLGKLFPSTVGDDVCDKTGSCHLGIIEFPVPILRGNPTLLKELRKRLHQPEYSELTAVDFSDVAKGCKTYGEFTEKIARVPERDLNYFGIAVCGNRKQVNKLTGSIALLR